MTIINSQLGGKKPTGTINISQNGVYDVTDFSSADVQVPTTAPAHYIEKTLSGGALINGSSYVISLPQTIGSVSFDGSGYFVLAYAYYSDKNLTGNIDLSSVKAIYGKSSFFYTFSGCSNITSVDLSNLEGIWGVSTTNVFEHAFSWCTNLTSLNISKLVVPCGYIFENAFLSCPITELKFSSIKCFNFPNNGATFANTPFNAASGIQHVYFPAVRHSSFYMSNGTALYSYMFNLFLKNTTGVTMHFPSNLDPQTGDTTISSLNNYPNFSGTNTVLAFDLPATVELTGANNVVYERSPKDDTNSALAWRKKDTGTAPYFTIDWTPFYTSGTTDPAVSDTIYSDSACTVAVTTISSIA